MQVYSLADSIRTWMVSVPDMVSVSISCLLLNASLIICWGLYFVSVGDEAEIPCWQNERPQ